MYFILFKCIYSMYFRFNPLTFESQVNKLKQIAQSENLTIESKIIEYIITITDGDLRRSINLLQSVSQFSGNLINEQIVNDICGVIPMKEVGALFTKSKSSSPLEIYKLVEDFLHEGFDSNQLLVQLTDFIIGSKDISDKDKANFVFKIAQSERMMIESANSQLVITKFLCSVRQAYLMN